MAFSALLIPKLGSEFMPKAVSSEFSIELTLPEGTSLTETQSTLQKSEGIIKELLGNKTEMIFSQAGGDNNSSVAQSTSTKNDNYARLKIILKKIK